MQPRATNEPRANPQPAPTSLLLFLLHQHPHLRNRNHRQITNEKVKQRKKKPNSPSKSHVIPTSRIIHSPRRRNKIAVQRSNHNHKPFQPHPHIHHQRNHEQRPHRSPHLLNPHQLRNRNVAQNQRPVSRPVRPCKPIQKSKSLVLIRTKKRRKSLHHVPVSHNQPGSQHHLGHILE